MNTRSNFAFLFLIGFLYIFRVNIIGNLTVSEIILISITPFVGNKALRFVYESEYGKKVIVFWLLYLLGQVLTDLIRDTPSVDYLRGWAKIAILGLNFILIAYFSQLEIKRLIGYFWGYGVGSIFFNLVIGGYYTDTWKFGMGLTTSILMALAAGIPIIAKRKFLVGCLFIGLGVFHLLMDARSLAGLTLMSGFFFMIPRRYYEQIDPRRVFNLSIIIPAGLLVSVIYIVYSIGAPAGWFGEESKYKYELQTRNSSNFLFSARGESSSSIAAIMDSPLWGHGSWAKDEKYVMIFLKTQDIDEESQMGKEMLEHGDIPTHSHLLGAWVEAGILGFMFWALAFRYALLAIMSSFRIEDTPYRLFIIFTLLFFLWDLPFSPFGMERRMGNAAVITLCITLMENYKVFHYFKNLVFSRSSVL